MIEYQRVAKTVITETHLHRPCQYNTLNYVGEKSAPAEKSAPFQPNFEYEY